MPYATGRPAAALIPVECHPKPSGRDDLVVIAYTGEMWAGDSAWLMVLWALAEYRGWAHTPALEPPAAADGASGLRRALGLPDGLVRARPFE